MEHSGTATGVSRETLREAVTVLSDRDGEMTGQDQSERDELDQSTGVEPPSIAEVIFGPRLYVAQRYREILATDGISHGLMGPREVPRLWDRHILNCAVLGELIDQGASVIDLGSGAGLPGLALAIARPDLHITMVEPLLRRSEFLERAVHDLELQRARVVRGRAEEKSVRKEIGRADVVTSRALAPLGRLAKWSGPLVATGGRMVAIKGSSAPEEIERDQADTRRAGFTRLTVQTCGAELLPSPTTVIVGELDPSRAPKRR